MKDFKFAKTIQMLLMIVLTAFIVLAVFRDSELYHELAQQASFHKLFLGFWALMVVCFGFLVYDFYIYAGLKRKYGEIDMALYSDPMTGIGNRSSLDAFIDEYSDKDLPVGTGAITFTITHMAEINNEFGNKAGDVILKDFSNILAEAGKGKCFVGRNGGNNFLALFKESSEDKLQDFVNDVYEKVQQRNGKTDDAKLAFKLGAVIYGEHDEKLTMSQLVAKSYRIGNSKNEDYENGKAGCSIFS